METSKPKEQSKPKCSPPASKPVDTHVHDFLEDMASSWKRARRNQDRDMAGTILQLTLKGIPPGAIGLCQCTQPLV